MALTNAERQQRYREKHKGTAGLTEQQIVDRNAIAAAPSPFVSFAKDDPLQPRFMGWDRHRWRQASVELAEHFGMREAWERWQTEWKDHVDRVSHANERARDILQGGGRRAGKIWRERGALGLCAAYDADPTLGAKVKGKTVGTH